MEAASVNPNVCGGESREYIDMGVDEDFVASLYARTEPIRCGQHELRPTERQAKILRDLWGRPTVRKADVAKALGVSTGVVRRWAEEMEAVTSGH